MSFIIGTHYCSGEAIETKLILGETHLGCGMREMKETCRISDHFNKINTYEKTPCCQNEYQTIQSSYEFLNVAAPLAYNVNDAITHNYPHLNLDLFPMSIPQIYTEYISPPLEKDIHVLFQAFLI